MTSATIPGLDSAPTEHAGLLAWVQEVAELTQPDRVVFADGSEEEFERLAAQLVEAGTFKRLDEANAPHSFLALSDPSDVARVLVNYDPKVYTNRTVVTARESEQAAISVSRITRSRWRAPITACTALPAARSARAIGSSSAVPTPPPTQATAPWTAMGVGFPRGPSTSASASPARSAAIWRVVLPTAWTIRVIVPAAASPSTIVNGIRSPPSATRTITKCPASRLRATRGASTT